MVFLSDSIYISDMPKDELYSKVAAMIPLDRLIVPPDVMRGRLVLKEALEAGNFGQYDKRNWFGHSALGHNQQRLYRDMRLVRYFPEEALSEPFFRIWHFFWRKRIVR